MRKRCVVLFLLLVLLFPSCKDYIPFIEQTYDTFEHLPEITGKIYISENNQNGHGKPVSISLSFEEDGFSDFSYQWYSCDDEFKTNAREIEGATLSTYTTDEISEIGKIYYYFCRVSAKKGIIRKTLDSSVQLVCCTGLPTLTISVEDNKPIVDRENKLKASFSYVSDNQSFTVEGTIKGRGNSSWVDFPKRSYTLKFDSGQKIGSMAKSKKWVVISSYNDKSLLRNWFASYLDNTVLASSGDWDPSYQSVDLIINGEYIGNYLLGEQIKIDGKRIDIQDISEDPSNPDSGSFVIEANFRFDETYNFVSSLGIMYSLKDPDLADLKEESEETADSIAEYIENKINECEAVLSNLDTSEYQEKFDYSSFIDWYIVNEIAKTYDARFGTSVYLYYDANDGKIHMGPDWDFDDSWGGSASEDRYKTEGFYLNWAGYYAQLFKDPVFVQQLKNRWNSKYEEILNATQVLQEQADKISKSADLNFVRWSLLGEMAYTTAPGYTKRKTYQSEIDYFKNWYSERVAWLNTAINNL